MQLTMVANGHWPSRVSLACCSRLRLMRRLLMKRRFPSLRNSSAIAGVVVDCVSEVWVFIGVPVGPCLKGSARGPGHELTTPVTHTAAHVCAAGASRHSVGT